jgi:integrase
MPNLNAEATEVAVYSPESLQRLASVLWNSREEPPTLSVLLYVVLGAFAGLRPAEAVALEWKHIDWDKREIRLEASTAKLPRTVPIKDNLLAFLLPYKGRNGLVVIHKKVANLLRNQCAQAGVSHISNGLRRSYASYRLGEVPAEIVQSEMGMDSSNRPEWKTVPASEVAKYWAVQP